MAKLVANRQDREAAAMVLWILTMPPEEAASISAATADYRDDKPRVAVFIVGWWKAKMTR